VENEIESLKKELAEAKAQIEILRLNLSNVTLLLRKEMIETGKLTNPTSTSPGRLDSVADLNQVT
jgi:hypothetical protein